MMDRKMEHPPASKRARTRLAKVLLTEDVLKKRMNRVCSICLEDHILGSTARRMPCQHLFCEECILEWLSRDNRCPMCQYQLPTDSVVYERYRKNEMKSRKLRVSNTALKNMRLAELTRLCEYMSVDLSKCINRVDLEKALKESGKIQLIEEEKEISSMKDEVSEDPISLISRSRWSSENLSCLRVRDLKYLMKRLNLPSNCMITKSDLIGALVKMQADALC